MAGTGMDYEAFFALCRARRSVRRFLPDKPSAEQLEMIRQAALTSPFASGKKNWALTLVTEAETISAMGEAVKRRTDELGEGIREDFRTGFLRYAENFHIFSTAPALLIPSYRHQPTLSLLAGGEVASLEQWERDNYQKSISCAAMLVLLAAESLGLGGCYMTGPLLAAEELAQLARTPRGHELGAIIPMGYAADG